MTPCPTTISKSFVVLVIVRVYDAYTLQKTFIEEKEMEEAQREKPQLKGNVD